MENKFHVEKSCREIRAEAREKMSGNMGWYCGLGVLTLLLELLIMFPANNVLSTGQTYGLSGIYALGTVVSIIAGLVAYLIGIGYINISLRLYEGKKSGFSDMWFAFGNRPGRFLLYYILLMLFSTACMLPGTFLTSLGVIIGLSQPEELILTLQPIPFTIILMGVALLIVGAIIFVIVSLSLVAVVYLMIENPDMRAIAAWRASRRIMRGNKWKYFVLCLSFTGWVLLGVITFFVAYIWVYPYIIEAQTVFYKEIRASAERYEQNP